MVQRQLTPRIEYLLLMRLRFDDVRIESQIKNLPPVHVASAVGFIIDIIQKVNVLYDSVNIKDKSNIISAICIQLQ